MLTAIVTTTINIPVVLEDYIENCRRFGHKDVIFIVVGDLRTPAGCAAYVHGLSGRGYPCHYLSPLDQERLLRGCPQFTDFLPYNVVQRRNVGYLHAYALGAEIIISIDDDNFPFVDQDFIGLHGIVGRTVRCDSVSMASSWYNSCSRLDCSPPRRFYHRGYPVNKRWLDDAEKWASREARVVVNAGLWTEDPDVDTITRLEEPFTVTGIRNPDQTIAVAPGTLLPFNSQSTAFHRDLLPALYLVAFPEEGNPASCRNFRYDDIWMSFFIKVVADHLGDMVCIGPPHVRQTRNPHDYLVDLRREIVPMELTAKLADLLPRVSLTETTYGGAYAELIENLHVLAAYNPVFTEREQGMLRRMLSGMRLWHQAASHFEANARSGEGKA
jgi:hypothetical protein